MTVSSETLRSISTPRQLQTRLGTLEFANGVPRSETVETVYDHLDYVHALNVFLNGYAGASTVALRKGLEEAGADDNQVLIFSELMDSASLFLTANADTAYFLSMIDLRPRPDGHRDPSAGAGNPSEVEAVKKTYDRDPKEQERNGTRTSSCNAESSSLPTTVPPKAYRCAVLPGHRRTQRVHVQRDLR